MFVFIYQITNVVFQKAKAGILFQLLKRVSRLANKNSSSVPVDTNSFHSFFSSFYTVSLRMVRVSMVQIYSGTMMIYLINSTSLLKNSGNFICLIFPTNSTISIDKYLQFKILLKQLWKVNTVLYQECPSQPFGI